jgi:hypothetical protein
MMKYLLRLIIFLCAYALEGQEVLRDTTFYSGKREIESDVFYEKFSNLKDKSLLYSEVKEGQVSERFHIIYQYFHFKKKLKIRVKIKWVYPPKEYIINYSGAIKDSTTYNHDRPINDLFSNNNSKSEFHNPISALANNPYPVKQLYKIKKGATLQQFISPYIDSDSTLQNPAIRNAYNILLKEYNRQNLQLYDEIAYQNFTMDTPVTNAEYLWVLNLPAMMIEQFDELTNEKNMNAEVSDLMQAYREGALKFISVKRN